MKKTNNNKLSVTKKNIVQETATDELRKLSTILISIVAIICIFYIITAIVTKRNRSLKYTKEESISQISYTDILASDILKKGDSYYVLVKDSTDVYVSLFETYISSYLKKTNHLPVYSVDLNDALNQSYKANQSDFESEHLQFQRTTLLKITNGIIEAVYETNDTIDEYLKSLVLG